jgi:hypothetical protein
VARHLILPPWHPYISKIVSVEYEHCRMLGSYFGNVIKQKKKPLMTTFFTTSKQVAVVLYYGCVVVCEKSGRRAITLVVVD